MSSPSHWLVVANPLAGKDKNRKIRDQVLQALAEKEQSFNLIERESFFEVEDELLASLQREQDLRGILVVGGDGTIHHVAQTIWRAGYDLPIAVVPQGTGNDFARQLGLYGKRVADLLEFFISDDPVKVDVLTMDEHLALQVISTGLDASVSHQSRKMPSFLGQSRYVLALLKQLRSLPVIRYDLMIDGQRHQKEAILVAVANGRNYGGGMLISPHSINDDGLFEIILVAPVGRLRLLLLFPRIFTGRHIDHPLVTALKGTSVKIEADTIAEADGEPLSSGPLDHLITLTRLQFWRM